MPEPQAAATLTVADIPETERQPCEVWTRVMGYYRPVSSWNPGKRSEQAERVLFRETPAFVQDPTGQLKLGI